VRLSDGEGPALVGALRRRFPQIKAVYLARDAAGWSAKLPGELVLPADPVPVEALTVWAQAMESSMAAGPARLGDYQLLEVIAESADVVTHRALQCSVHRIVALDRLKSSVAANPDAVRRFRALVRAKAAVVHQHIASVYEAQEMDGAVFYTRELVDGRTLPELLHAGVRLPEHVVLALLQAAAAAAVYFDQHKIPRGPLTPRDVTLGSDGLPRVANIALGQPQDARDEHAELVAMAQAANALVDPAIPAPELIEVVTRVREPSAHGLRTWEAFAGVVAASRQRAADVVSPSTRKLSAGTYAIVMKRRRRKQYLFVAIVAFAAMAGGLLVYWIPFLTAPKPRDFSAMSRVPAGEFVYQLGEKRTTTEFWIDTHEVTIHGYAAFLDHLRRFPGVSYDHPRQPSTKSTHMPQNWEAYYRAARRGGTYLGLRVNVNCPITTIDYWDAWAFARWKGRRLPTEIEWEKAARGTDGRLFPWGSDADPARVNSGADFADSGGGTLDGFTGWAPVDAHVRDVSPYGVTGMGGNVSEWTDSLMLHPELIDQQVPVLRGGSFSTKSCEVTVRRPARSPEHGDMATGFRTVSDTAP
jgi:formylglycine-generating enzyme required for sulfatase activity